MIKILMCGPILDFGGAAIHTQSISKCISDMGNLVIVYNTSTNPSSFRIFEYLLKLWRKSFGIILYSISTRNKYDIIHVQCSGGFFSFISAISGSLISKILKKNLVITFHYRPSKEFINKYYRYIRFVLKKSDAFFVVSEKQKALINQIIPLYSSKVYVIPNGFYPDKFTILDQTLCRDNLNLPLNKKILLSIGNLVPEKGQKYLIEAMSEIVKQRNDIICVIVGSGSMKSDLETLISKLQLTNYVKLVGKKPHDEIPLWINGCDVFVLPSLIEGNPTVMFECLGCGKPFVGTKVGGIPEIIASDKYGLLVTPNDLNSLVSNILISLDFKWDRKEIRKYSENYSWLAISNIIENIYKSIK